MSDPPSADEVSIPSSVRKAGADARIAEREAGDWTHNDVLRDLVEKWRENGSPADKACADELESVIGSNSEAEDGT